jgi:PadR family transcriptional regulator, regulatory protein PadR
VATPEEPAGGLPRNYLRACVLLLLQERPAHGYDLIEGVRGLGLDRADPGGLYRAMRAMEQEGLVTSWWEESQSGPARRSYTLTAEGREWLHAWAGTLREVRRHLDTYLGRYAEVGQSMPRDVL